MTRRAMLLAWGFWVQAATVPALLPTAWYTFGPFDTKEECDAVRNGAISSGAYREVDLCEQW